MSYADAVAPPVQELTNQTPNAQPLLANWNLNTPEVLAPISPPLYSNPYSNWRHLYYQNTSPGNSDGNFDVMQHHHVSNNGLPNLPGNQIWSNDDTRQTKHNASISNRQNMQSYQVLNQNVTPHNQYFTPSDEFRLPSRKGVRFQENHLTGDYV